MEVALGKPTFTKEQSVNCIGISAGMEYSICRTRSQGENGKHIDIRHSIASRVYSDVQLWRY